MSYLYIRHMGDKKYKIGVVSSLGDLPPSLLWYKVFFWGIGIGSISPYRGLVLIVRGYKTKPDAWHAWAKDKWRAKRVGELYRLASKDIATAAYLMNKKKLSGAACIIIMSIKTMWFCTYLFAHLVRLLFLNLDKDIVFKWKQNNPKPF